MPQEAHRMVTSFEPETATDSTARTVRERLGCRRKYPLMWVANQCGFAPSLTAIERLGLVSWAELMSTVL